MTELMAEAPQGGNENRRHENSPLSYAVRNDFRDFIFSRSEVELLNKSYGDGSSNEICAVELDQGKIDELANNYRAETCVSYSHTIRNESHKETVKNDGTFLRNEDEFRCKSNRKRKMRREMPKGIIIDLSKDIYGTFHNGVKINVISMHNLVSKMKLITISKKHLRASTWNRSLKKKIMNKMIDGSVLVIFCTENCGKNKINKGGKATKRKRKNRKNELMDNVIMKSGPVNRIINIPTQSKDTLNDRELYVENDLAPLSCMPEILDSTKCCHDDYNAPIDIDNAQYPVLNTGHARIGATRYTANHCCSIFNDKRQEYHICDREDYNTDSDFNAEMRADWTTECFHPECIHTGECRCFHDSSEYYLDINMQHDCCPLASMRTAGVFKNSALPKKHQRKKAERCESTNVATEFARYGYSPNRDERRESLTSTIRKCSASRTSVFVEPSESVDLRNSRLEKCGQRTTSTATLVSRNDERPDKSNSLKAVDTPWKTRRDDRVRSRCVVAKSSHSDCRKKVGSARGMDSEWKQGTIETDVQQLDYKWKRKIASVDCEEKRDSRSQTRSDNTNVDSKRRETRDYSLWTSLQMGKIWSQAHNVCKNVVKLAATSIGRVLRDASKSKRSRNLVVQVTDANHVESSGKICEEIHDKNLTRTKNGKERTIGNVTNECRNNMGESTRVVASSGYEMREQVHFRNVEKEENEKSCVFYEERERDRYRGTLEFLPQNETYDHDENAHPQSRLSGFLTYLENSAYPGVRNRGGSDDGRNSTESTEDKQKSVRRIYEESRSVRYHRNCTSKKCACCNRMQESRERRVDDQNSRHADVCHEPSVTTDRQTIRADHVSDVSRSNPPHRSEPQSSVSVPRDNRQSRKTSEQTKSREKMEAYENAECAGGAETEKDSTSEIAEIAHATRASSTDLTVHSSRNNPDEPTASTSKWESTLFISPGESRKNRPGSRSPFCTTAMKFWRKRPIVNNKIIAPFKRSRGRNNGRREPSSVITHDSGMKITQIEPSTVQTAREGNKKRTNVNLRLQTPDAIVARILSEFLVSGETRKRVSMSITLESKSDHDVSDKKEVETQTSFNDITFARTDVFRLPGEWPQAPLAPTSKIVQCFVCDKRDCYEIKRSNNSITLEDALTAEYPETSELNDHFAERKTDFGMPP